MTVNRKKKYTKYAFIEEKQQDGEQKKKKDNNHKYRTSAKHTQ